MVMGIAAKLFQKSHDKPVICTCLLTFGQSNPSWIMPEDREPQPTVAGEKCKAVAGEKQQGKSKKAKPSTPKEKPLRWKLAPKMEETEAEKRTPTPPPHSHFWKRCPSPLVVLHPSMSMLLQA